MATAVKELVENSVDAGATNIGKYFCTQCDTGVFCSANEILIAHQLFMRATLLNHIVTCSRCEAKRVWS